MMTVYAQWPRKQRTAVDSWRQGSDTDSSVTPMLTATLIAPTATQTATPTAPKATTPPTAIPKPTATPTATPNLSNRQFDRHKLQVPAGTYVRSKSGIPNLPAWQDLAAVIHF